MRQLFVMCIFILPLFSIFPQEYQDSVDLRKIVAEQIAKAQIKNQEIQVEEKHPIKVEEYGYNISGLKLAFILLLLLWGTNIWLKKNKNESIQIKQQLQSDPRKNTQLIRARLKDSLLYNMNEDEVSKAARELNIGKGEFYLAAFLKAKELNNIAARKY